MNRSTDSEEDIYPRRQLLHRIDQSQSFFSLGRNYRERPSEAKGQVHHIDLILIDGMASSLKNFRTICKKIICIGRNYRYRDVVYLYFDRQIFFQ